MKPEKIFTDVEISRMRNALGEFRTPGAYEPGKWSVSQLNREYGSQLGKFPDRIIFRDITLRTMAQMPGVALSEDERLHFLAEIVRAGVPEIKLSSFRRSTQLATMQREVAAAKAVLPSCEIMYGNAVKPQDMELAAAAGHTMVQVWTATFLGEAMPASAGAVYHRLWQGREWRDLRFPKTSVDHFERTCRLVRAGRDAGLKVICVINLCSYADEKYVHDFCRTVAQQGAYEVVLADSSGGCGPEAMAKLVEAAKSGAPKLRVGLHTHNVFGLGIAASIAGARAGAEVVEVAINGYDFGTAGCQTTLAGAALAFEALYGVDTGIDLHRLNNLAELGQRLTGMEIPWNEPVLGSCALHLSADDEYYQEALFDPLIHGAYVPELVGAKRRYDFGMATGPLGLSDKLAELGIGASKSQIEPIMQACREEMRARKRHLQDQEIAEVANRVLAVLAQEPK